MKVSELKARAPVPEIELEIVSKGEIRKWASDSGEGTVCNCAGKDKTGEVSVSLWNADCDKVEEGDKIKITNGWVNEYRGQLQLSAGKKGSLEVLK
ncbi:MAG TPA: SOSS complex subunit B family protein [archaeon]|nr:SOSS complex subunit B family protein [archaeon]